MKRDQHTSIPVRLGPISLSIAMLHQDNLLPESKRHFVGIRGIIGKILGRVVNVHRWPTIYMIEITDNSGKELYVKTEASQGTVLKANDQLTAMGSIQELDGDLIMTALRFSLVTDADEQKCHDLEILAQQLYRNHNRQLGRISSLVFDPGEDDASDLFRAFDPMDISEPLEQTIPPPSAQESKQPHAQVEDKQEKQDEQTSILNLIQRHSASGTGVSIEGLHRQLLIAKDTIYTIIQSLLESGHIIPIHDGHFLAI